MLKLEPNSDKIGAEMTNWSRIMANLKPDIGKIGAEQWQGMEEGQRCWRAVLPNDGVHCSL